MQTTRATTNKNTFKKTILGIDPREADLLLHALKEYARIKGYEVSLNTTNLMKKLNRYLSLDPQD